MKPFLASFLHGLFWPFTWLESRVASVDLLVSVFLLIAIASATGLIAVYLFPSSDSNNTDSISEGEGNSDNCNALGVEIRDCIWTYRPEFADGSSGSDFSNSCDVITSSEEVVSVIESARDDDQIKAILLEIDSTGGMPVAAEEIANALKELGKPSIAWIRGNGDSAAYWIASAADTIIAAENSDVGSIGVTQSYVDNAQQNIKKGLTFNQLSTGLYKDTGNPDKPLSADERTYLERDLNIILNNFIQTVATNRHLSVEKVTALADGSSMLGAMALKNGLIDQIGTKQQVWDALERQIGEKPEVCW